MFDKEKTKLPRVPSTKLLNILSVFSVQDPKLDSVTNTKKCQEWRFHSIAYSLVEKIYTGKMTLSWNGI